MSDIIAAADSTALTTLLVDAENALGTITKSGSGSLGPFGASYSVSVSFSGGTVGLNPPNVEIANCSCRYSVSLSFSISFDDFLPHLCFPQVCLFGLCTPAWCVDWPTITVPFSFGDTVTFTADFLPVANMSSGVWDVNIVITSIPSLQFGGVTAGVLAALGLALSAAMLAIPFIGPYLAAAVAAIVAAIGVAGLTGFLGLIITPFVAGLQFTVFSQPQKFPVLPAGGPVDPAVNITIAALDAKVQGAPDKNELVIDGNIAA